MIVRDVIVLMCFLIGVILEEDIVMLVVVNGRYVEVRNIVVLMKGD